MRSEDGARGREDTARPRAARVSWLPVLRPVREVLTGLGQVIAGNARSAASQEAWPELRLGRRKSPWREPRWNADRRAGTVARRRTARCGGCYNSACRRSASFLLRCRGKMRKGPAFAGAELDRMDWTARAAEIAARERECFATSPRVRGEVERSEGEGASPRF